MLVALIYSQTCLTCTPSLTDPDGGKIKLDPDHITQLENSEESSSPNIDQGPDSCFEYVRTSRAQADTRSTSVLAIVHRGCTKAFKIPLGEESVVLTSGQPADGWMQLGVREGLRRWVR